MNMIRIDSSMYVEVLAPCMFVPPRFGRHFTGSPAVAPPEASGTLNDDVIHCVREDAVWRDIPSGSKPSATSRRGSGQSDAATG